MTRITWYKAYVLLFLTAFYALVLVASATSSGRDALAPSLKFSRIDRPGAMFILPENLNDRGQIVGVYWDSRQGGKAQNFLLDHGVYTTFRLPHAADALQVDTINERGQVIGTYMDDMGDQHSFLLSRGTYKSINIPGATQTEAVALNDRGQVVGSYVDAHGHSHGFLWAGGVCTTFEPSDVKNGSGAVGINDGGQIVGTWWDSQGRVRSYLLRRGVYTWLNFPGTNGSTEARVINAQGHVLGNAGAGLPPLDRVVLRGWGFLWSPGGYTRIAFPGASGTVARGINDRDQVVGSYEDGHGRRHGFLFSRGVYTDIDIPGAIRTDAIAINCRGQIVGNYADANKSWHGFLATFS